MNMKKVNANKWLELVKVVVQLIATIIQIRLNGDG